MKIYFAGSIRGGREKVEDYKKIISALSVYGQVLTEHIGSDLLSKEGEKERTDIDIYTRDVAWIDESDIVIAEVTVASLGVGYELGYAEGKNKRIICLYQTGGTGRLSAMVSGNTYVEVVTYTTIEDLLEKIAKLLA